jgi:hypothetical protein
MIFARLNARRIVSGGRIALRMSGHFMITTLTFIDHNLPPARCENNAVARCG